MPAIRLSQSAEPLLPFCRRSDDPAENACFETYADFIAFAAACGFHRLNGRLPSEPIKFLPSIYPIDIAIFKNQQLFPNLLLIGLAAEGKADIARDEERLCRLIEGFADVGCKYLSHELSLGVPVCFHLDLSELLEEVSDPISKAVST
jgi:hypothetical protein